MGGTDEEAAARDEAQPEHNALPEPVRGQAPRQQGQTRADPGSRQQETDLSEREAEVVLQRGQQNRDPGDERRRSAGGRGRAAGQHRPPVPRPLYSPKGLIGRAPVETITLFVSR